MKSHRPIPSILLNLALAVSFGGSFIFPSGRPFPAFGSSEFLQQGMPEQASTSLARLLRLVGNQGASSAAGDQSYLQKLDSHIQDLVSAHLSGQDVSRAAASEGLRMGARQDVLVDVYLSGPLPDSASQLSRLGMQVLATNEAFGGMVEGYLPVAAVLSAAQLSATRAFISVIPPQVGTGSVTSQGDAAHNGPAARLLGPTGAGVTAGIISDSMNQVSPGVTGSKATGDLPANVTVLSDFAGGNDEGRAMAEILYDTAPGITNMYFATGVTGPVSKADAINNLKTHGVQVVADDVLWLGEPFFQDGVVAQAVDNAYAGGVAYFAAAGNFAQQSYESSFQNHGNGSHDFSPGGLGDTTLQQIIGVPSGGSISLILQWDDPWGHATHDFDFYLFTASGADLARSESPNISNGIPLEYIYWKNTTGSTVYVADRILKKAGSDAAYLKYLAYGDFGPFSIIQYNTSSETIAPDAASAAGAMTVAAVRYNDIGLNHAEPYSSRGPSITRFFDAAGVRLGSPIVRLKPNIAAADCVATSNNFSGGVGFSGGTFCGTSAAAPAAAAIAALALSANPALTPPGLYAVLGHAADTIDCTPPGNPDADCGYGFMLADKVVRNAMWTLPWYGSVSITSNRNVVAVGRPHVGAEVMTYDSVSSGSLTSFLPMLFKGAWGSYNSAFYIQNVDPSHSADVNINYYKIDGTLTCGPVADSIPPLSSHGIWVPDVSCLPSGWVGAAVVTSSNYPIVTVARPHVGAEVMTYNGFASGSLTSYLPMLFKNAFGGSYLSAFYVQNVDASHSAHIQIDYFDTSGAHTCGPIADTIPPLSSHGTWVPGVSCLPSGWVGGVVVTSSDYPIVAVARPHVGTQVTTYDGFPTGSTTSYLPMLFKNGFGGTYDSAFYIQNLDTSHSASVTIQYYDASGTPSCSPIPDSIPPLSSHGIWVPSVSCLPVGWVGSVVVTSATYPIVAVARPHLGAQVAAYDGFPGGGSPINVPMLFKNMWTIYNSALYVQNTDSGGPASVTLNFYRADGTLSCTRSDTIPASGTLGYWIPSLVCTP